MTKLNFDLIKGRLIELQHHPKDELVELVVLPSDRSDQPVSTWLDYEQFVSLLDILQAITIGRNLKTISQKSVIKENIT